MAVHNPSLIEVLDEGVSQGHVTSINVTGAGASVSRSGYRATLDVPGGGGPGGNPTYNAFTKDLGVAKRSGTFDITGLSGLTADKVVNIVQTNAQISSRGNARDESEMDHISVTGYVVDATTIRAYWHAPSVCVGEYAFAYWVSA